MTYLQKDRKLNPLTAYQQGFTDALATISTVPTALVMLPALGYRSGEGLGQYLGDPLRALRLAAAFILVGATVKLASAGTCYIYNRLRLRAPNP